MTDETYVEAHIDFAGLQTKLAALNPPRIELAEVLERIRPHIERKVQEGVSAKEIAAALGEFGIRISGQRLRGWIETGRVPARAARRPQTDGDPAPEPDSPSPSGPPAPRGFPLPDPAAEPPRWDALEDRPAGTKN